MEYAEALEWVHSLPRFGGAPGLERMRRLMAELGNPQDSLRFVHVAGTNGKGSAVMMLAGVLRAAGHKTGANISPYVLDFTERIQADGRCIAPERLAEILTRVRRTAERMGEAVIEFEAVTAAAFLYFADEACDIVCLETGLGGRLDATNIIQNTLVACVMRIGLDHTQVLGDTLEEIAREKCGIFKNRCRVVSYPCQAEQAAAEICRQAKSAECRLVVPSLADATFGGGVFDGHIAYKGIEARIALPGRHQAYNSMVVMEAAFALREQGYDITDAALRQGIGGTRFAARVEVMSRSPLVIIDGAHNADSAEALAEVLREARLTGLAVVMGLLQDKDAGRILEVLAPYVGVLHAVAPDSPRALAAEKLADMAGGLGLRHETHGDVRQALAAASLAPGGGMLVCGSLYLAAEARAYLSAQEDGGM